MTEVRIRRKSVVATATVGTSTADASAMDCNAMVGGIITFEAELPTAATALTFYASDTATGPYYQLHDKDGAAVSVTLTTTTGVAYALPYDVGGCGWLRIVSNAALGTASTARVALKG
jgi:hypothetical protein